MSLTFGKSAENSNDFLARQEQRFGDRCPFDHFGQGRTAGERGRAAVGEEAHRFDAPITDTERESEAVATHRINLFGGCVGVRQFAGVTRIGEMIFEEVGVGHN